MDIRHYDTLASILYYPEQDYVDKVSVCQYMLNVKYPEIADQFQPFKEFVENIPTDELNQIYIRTFDIQALCCMDVGYVLFGEDYTRGKILANLNKELHQAGIDCRGELADRLPNILCLLPHLQDKELLEELVSYLLKPALEKMVNDFVPNRIREKEGIYQKFHKTVLEKREDYVTKFRIPLSMIQKVLDIDFPELEKVEIANGKDYMQSVEGELKNNLKENKF